MSAAFIAAVVDTLLPGDSGGPAGEPALPAGSKVGFDFNGLAKAHHALFDAIANQAGSTEAFTAAGEPERAVAVQTIERAMPDVFRALLSTLLAEYYESASVLTAMGWRADPPQPRGHEIKKNEIAMERRLECVRKQRKLWHDQ